MFESLKKRHNLSVQKRAVNDARFLFQVKEKNGELWFTYNGFSICPMAMFKTDPIDTLKTIRELYVANNKK